MIYGKGRISLRQALLLNLVTTASISLRVIPSYTIQYAKQAAWLTPLVSFGIFLVYYMVLDGLFKKNKEKSFVEILQNVIGKSLGKGITILYFIWLTFYIAFSSRVFAERIVHAIFPAVDIIIFILTMLLFVAYVMRSDLVVLARMSEIIFISLLAIYIITEILILPEINIDNFLPLTYQDIYPVFKGSIGIIGIWSFLIVPFLFGDRINDMDKIKTLGLKVLLVQFSAVFTIINPLGVFGWSICNKMPFPYYTSIREISLFGIFERLELSVIIVVIFSDLILIALFSFAALHILKFVFQTSNPKPLINIYLVLIFFLSLIIGRNYFELEALSKVVIIPLNIFMGLILPVFIFLIGKIRRKV